MRLYRRSDPLCHGQQIAPEPLIRKSQGHSRSQKKANRNPGPAAVESRGEGHAIHQGYAGTPFASHGCVRVPTGTAETLWYWIDLWLRVEIVW